MIHYTYLIIHKVTRVKYIGVRTDKHNDMTQTDIVTGKYITSSSNNLFKEELEKYPENFYIRPLKFFDTRKQAEMHETYLHWKYDVGPFLDRDEFNLRFYNLNKSIKFSDGKNVIVSDQNQNVLIVSNTDPRLTSKELKKLFSPKKRICTACNKVVHHYEYILYHGVNCGKQLYNIEKRKQEILDKRKRFCFFCEKNFKLNLYDEHKEVCKFNPKNMKKCEYCKDIVTENKYKTKHGSKCKFRNI